MGLYKEKIAALGNIGLGFEPCTGNDFFQAALAYQERYGLLMNDSLILATAFRLEADVLVTADAAFRGVSGIQVAMPSDLRP